MRKFLISRLIMMTAGLGALSMLLYACDPAEPPHTSESLVLNNRLETVISLETSPRRTEESKFPSEISPTPTLSLGVSSAIESAPTEASLPDESSVAQSITLDAGTEPAVWLQTYLSEKGLTSDQIGLVYIDLKSGQSSQHNENAVFVAASTIKVPMSMYTYDMAFSGQVQLNQLLTYRSETDYEGGSGTLQHVIQDGDQYEIAELLELAICQSDNIATNMIFSFWREQPGDLSLTTRMNQAYGLNYNGQAAMRAGEMAIVLDRLYHNPDNNPHYLKLSEDMKRTSFNAYATSQLPEGSYAHKYGLYGTFTNDVGIVYGDNPFIFSIYARDLPEPSTILGDIGSYLYRYANSTFEQDEHK